MNSPTQPAARGSVIQIQIFATGDKFEERQRASPANSSRIGRRRRTHHSRCFSQTTSRPSVEECWGRRTAAQPVFDFGLKWA